jgi:hypothetical protein
MDLSLSLSLTLSTDGCRLRRELTANLNEPGASLSKLGEMG